MASTAPSAGPGRCLRMGGFWALPPLFRSARFGGRVRSVWSRPEFGPQFLGTVSMAPCLAQSRRGSLLPGVPRGAAAPPTVRTQEAVRSPRGLSALHRASLSRAQVLDRWRAQVAKQAPGGAQAPVWFGGRTPGGWPPPFPLGGSALRTLSASSWVAGAARLAGLVLRRSGRGCVSPFPSGPHGSGVGIWLRTLGAFVAPRVG